MPISDDLLAIWNRIDQSGECSRLYGPDAKSYVMAMPEFQDVIRRIGAKTEGAPDVGLLALRLLQKQQAELAPRLADTELVATFPGTGTISARHTAQVVREVISAARRDLIVAGFAITEAGGLAAQLIEARRRGVRVRLLCSDWRPKQGPDALELLAASWPAAVPAPEVFRYSDPDGNSSMHIKCVIADGERILVGSANFTDQGMNRNFELGIRANGELARRAVLLIDEFIRIGRFEPQTPVRTPANPGSEI